MGTDNNNITNAALQDKDHQLLWLQMNSYIDEKMDASEKRMKEEIHRSTAELKEFFTSTVDGAMQRHSAKFTAQLGAQLDRCREQFINSRDLPSRIEDARQKREKEVLDILNARTGLWLRIGKVVGFVLLALCFLLLVMQRTGIIQLNRTDISECITVLGAESEAAE